MGPRWSEVGTDKSAVSEVPQCFSLCALDGLSSVQAKDLGPGGDRNAHSEAGRAQGTIGNVRRAVRAHAEIAGV